MKNILIDLCLIGLLLFFMNSFLNDQHIEQALLQKNIETFETEVKDHHSLQFDEGVYDKHDDNTLSSLIKTLSEICIKIIQTIVLIISQIISKLL